MTLAINVNRSQYIQKSTAQHEYCQLALHLTLTVQTPGSHPNLKAKTTLYSLITSLRSCMAGFGSGRASGGAAIFPREAREGIHERQSREHKYAETIYAHREEFHNDPS